MFLNRKPERPLKKSCGNKTWVLETPNMEKPELWDICQGKMYTESGTSPGERCTLQAAEYLEGRAPASFDTEHRTGFAFALLGFTLVLGQYFLTFWGDDNAYAVTIIWGKYVICFLIFKDGYN